MYHPEEKNNCKEIISVVIPCYNEELTIPVIYEEMLFVTLKMNPVGFEYIFVDDGSSDGTMRIIHELSLQDDRVRYVSFSRNFGKEAAIYAGLKKAIGDYVVFMDADLQDPPVLLIEMYDAIKNEGYDSVATRRVSREGESRIRSFFARVFYWLMQKISNTDIVDGTRDFRLMTRQMVDAILELSEYNRFSKGIFGWVGFNTKWLEYKNVQRVAGDTKWSFWGLFCYSLEGIVAFSTKPLQISSFFGILLCILSFVMMCFIIVRTLVWGDPVAGFPTLICVIFFLGGIQLFCIGVLGQYLSKTYLETKRRPVYIIKNEK